MMFEAHKGNMKKMLIILMVKFYFQYHYVSFLFCNRAALNRGQLDDLGLHFEVMSVDNIIKTCL